MPLAEETQAIDRELLIPVTSTIAGKLSKLRLSMDNSPAGCLEGFTDLHTILYLFLQKVRTPETSTFASLGSGQGQRSNHGFICGPAS